LISVFDMMARVSAASILLASGQDVFLAKKMDAPAGEFNLMAFASGHDINFLGGDIVAYDNPASSAECKRVCCSTRGSFELKTKPDCWTYTGDTNQCYCKDFSKVSPVATDPSKKNEAGRCDAEDVTSLASPAGESMEISSNSSVTGFVAVSGNGWCVDRDGNEGVNRAFGKGNDCMNKCQADRSCPGFAAGGQDLRCVWYTDNSPTTHGRPAESFSIDHAAWSKEQPQWSTAKCWKWN
jgi:hypothetical protein